MSSDDEVSSDEENNFEDDEQYGFFNCYASEDEEALSAKDHRLFAAVECNDAAPAAEAVQQAISDGADVDAVRDGTTPLFVACERGYDEIIRILLDGGADARWMNCFGSSAVLLATAYGHLSTVQLLINHDNSLLEMTDQEGFTPLFCAIFNQHSDIVQFLLNQGADAHGVDKFGQTALMTACTESTLEIVRLLLAAGVEVETRHESQQTALHYAAYRGKIEVVRELILQHNANMFAVDRNGLTPFDLASRLEQNADILEHLVEIYGNKLAQDHSRLAFHELLKVAKYSYVEPRRFHPLLNPLQIILPLGELRLKHLRGLLHTLDHALTRSRDDTGKLPIHIACQSNAPVEVLALIMELDPAALHIADSSGALPIHLLCGTTATTEYASMRYLVEQGGVGTLAARSRLGLLPLHVLCGSSDPPLRTVQYLIQSFPGSVAVQTNAGQYPFMMAAAAASSSATLNVVYELVRASPGLVAPR